MKPLEHEQVSIHVNGHDFKLDIDPAERKHVDSAAAAVTEKMKKLSERAGMASPAKLASMVAFQFACDLSIANELLDEAEKLHEELKKQKEAIRRLEDLLAKVDGALAY